jgi:hypothetical protein
MQILIFHARMQEAKQKRVILPAWPAAPGAGACQLLPQLVQVLRRDCMHHFDA